MMRACVCCRETLMASLVARRGFFARVLSVQTLLLSLEVCASKTPPPVELWCSTHSAPEQTHLRLYSEEPVTPV